MSIICPCATIVSMKKVQHLVETIKPTNYDLFINLNRKQKAFKGTVLTQFELQESTSKIPIHAKGLKLASAKVSGKPAKTEESDHDVVYLVVESQLEAGSHYFQVDFEGKITDPMVGLYPCYFKHGNEDDTLLATQFESHHAREVFPCIDEPAAKATFNLSIKTHKEDVVISNTPEQSAKVSGQHKTTVFEQTPVMSTYLLAFVTGNLEYLEAKTKSGISVKTWATPANVKFTEFSLDVAVKCLDYYEEFFKIAYPLEKCDMIALPDFAAGAMENWGCVTYRESAMLVDEKNTSLDGKQWVAMVVAHELAHQWFGNLVTMEWWTDLWLNEGFASWVEYMAVDKLFPDWQMWTQFVTDDYMRAQGLDSLANTHPVEVEVNDPDEIRNIFDAISYSKGASVIRMLFEYLGEEDFREGLAHYLNINKYKNAKTQDLWSALEEKSGKNVSEFMSEWTSQSGFPVVSAEISDDKIKLTQQRFIINPEERKKAKAQTWPIPIDSTHTKQQFLFKNAHDMWQTKSASFAKLNTDQTGFYVTKYSKEHLAKLADQVASGKIGVIDRLGLISDSFSLAQASYSSTLDALELLESYSKEDNAAVWDQIAGDISVMRRVMQTDDVRENLKPYLRALSYPQVERLGWKPHKRESHFDTLMRPTVLAMASLGENEEVVTEAIRRFNGAKSPEDIEPDLRSVVYGTAVRNGGKTEFDKLLSFYESTSSAQEKVKLASALCSFEQVELIEKSLELIKSNQVKLQEVSYWVAYCFFNRHARDMTWQWFKENWKWIVDKFGTDIMTIASFPNYPARVFASKELEKEYAEFFEKNKIPGLERPVKQGIEAIEWQTLWRERDEQKIADYLKAKQDPLS